MHHRAVTPWRVSYLSSITICHYGWMTQGQRMWQLKGYAINFSKGVVGRTESVEWEGLMPECFRERCGDDVYGQFRRLDSEREERKGAVAQGCRFIAMFFKLGSCKVFSVHQTWEFKHTHTHTHTHTIQIVCPECPLVTENYLGISVALIIFVFTIKSQPGSNTLKKTFQQKLFLLNQKKDDLHRSKHLFLCWQGEHWSCLVCDFIQLWRCLNRNEYSQWKMLRS